MANSPSPQRANSKAYPTKHRRSAGDMGDGDMICFFFFLGGGKIWEDQIVGIDVDGDLRLGKQKKHRRYGTLLALQQNG